ncbi:ATP-binding protein [Streptomyces sp. NPDC006976]|uniref:ATP-binding protein n=1 Tax=Streptomyces sp. NPDC006976 TaxID=3154311 RepID=UPI0033CF3899
MSLPLTRRIARTALLIAAGAAPVVGAAGAAGAAELPQAPDLGGLTSVEGSGLGKTAEGAAQPASDTAGKAGGKVVGTTLPVASKTLGDVGTKAAPAAKNVTKAAKGAADGDAVGTVSKTAEGGLPTDALTKGLPIG